MAIPVFQQPPNVPAATNANRDALVTAAQSLYNHPYNLRQRNYTDNQHDQCIKAVADSILRYAWQLQTNQRLDQGARIGTLNGNPLLHASFTHQHTGNCSTICEYAPANQTIYIHAIGSHEGDYCYDGVSNDLHVLLQQNFVSGNGCRYVNNTFNAVRF